METITCPHCNAVDDYRTSNSGPHVRADCNQCGRYIKFLKQSYAPQSICYTGKYYGKPFSAITDLDWLRWCHANAPMKNTQYRELFTARINELGSIRNLSPDGN